MRQKLIIDTDIGDDIDDAFALSVAMRLPEVEIVGVTTVYRNVDLRAKIVLALADACGVSFPVITGYDAPEREPVKHFRFEEILPDGRPNITHYGDDMAGYENYKQGGAEDFILETAAKYPHEVTLLSLGPCTNVAAAIKKDSQKFKLLKEVLVMGADPTGKIAEWNTRCDPEAFDAVMKCGVKMRVVGLDITNRCALNDERLARIFALKGEGNALLVRMLKRWISDRPNKIPTMHDPLTAALLERNFCTFEESGLQTVTEGADRGRTFRREGKEMQIAVEVDSEGFLDWMIECLSRPPVI